MDKIMINKYLERNRIFEKIHVLKEKKRRIDREFIKRFCTQYNKHHCLPVKTHFRVSAIHESDYQYYKWKGEFDSRIFYLAIIFIDSCKDDDYDLAIIPVSHFDTGITKDDLLTRRKYMDSLQEKQKENEEREEYARLKAKFK
jgi:hypothetical protein